MIYLGDLVGLLLIALIVWWFWLSKAKAKHSDSGIIKIIVENGVYNPARIEINSSQPVTLEFLRNDTSACSEYVVFEQLDVHEKLPLNRSQQIKLGKLNPGSYHFSCQMNMYVGELIVLK